MTRPSPAWLRSAVFYEIYPQSFQDTTGDGIGDFQGIIDRLDYIRSLGCNALWINPCFDSPFKDAGYDVRDYKKTAPRYGTNEDLYRLFEEAHKRGIRVLLDLVPGHTSEEHPWFVESGKASPNEYSERYIWTDFWIKGIKGRPYIGGECERNGVYMLNFFKCQPALNYGFKEKTENWQHLPEDPDCLATREAMKDVMRFWLSHGCDGFRVDMADSLVKEDDGNKSATCAVWRDLLTVLDEYPEAAMVAEWSNPAQAIAGAGFDMDFILDHPGNCYNAMLRDYENAATGPEDHSYFKKDGGCAPEDFLQDLQARYRDAQGGYLAWITCNHDTPRPSRSLTLRERELAFSVLMTLPGVPFLYYGDEIGMRYQEELPTKEGGYTRTGSRTPMQWSREKNMGFSEADAEALYLPVDHQPGAPDVQSQEGDPASLLATVRKLTALKAQEPGLDADAEFTSLVPSASHNTDSRRIWVYRRGDLLIAVNPAGESAICTFPSDRLTAKALFLIGTAECRVEPPCDTLTVSMGPQSFCIWKTESAR